MTVVYLDSFLLINFSMNYLLLLASCKLAGERVRKIRFALAAIFGAIYAACSFFPGLSFSVHPLYKISVAILMLLISFGKSQNLLRLSLVFLAVACAFCGAILAVEFLKGSSYMNDGIVYSSLDLKGLLLSAVFCYGIMALFFRRGALHHMQSGELATVVFELAGRRIELCALQDSGNTLQDPLSGQQVPVVEGLRLMDLLAPTCRLDAQALARPIETLERLAGQAEALRFRLLPYRAVGVDCGMLLALRVDTMIVQGERFANQLVALSPTPVSDGGAYSVLIACRPTAAEKERIGVNT